MSFDDLLAANAEFGATFTDGYFDGIAKAGVALVTCMEANPSTPEPRSARIRKVSAWSSR